MSLKTPLAAFVLAALAGLPAAEAGAQDEAESFSFLPSEEKKKTATTSPLTLNICSRTRHIRIALLLHPALLANGYGCAAVPRTALARIETLSVRGRLTELKLGDFDGLTRLQHLQLANNPLTALPAGVFNGLTSLRHLDLSGNRLAALPAGIFSGLTGLQRLNLRGNQLSTLPIVAFDGLTGLRHLDLRGNRLAALPAGIFDWLINLQTLDLRENHLVELQPVNPLFDYLPQGFRLLLSSQTEAPPPKLEDPPPPYRLRLWLPCDG